MEDVVGKREEDRHAFEDGEPLPELVRGSSALPIGVAHAERIIGMGLPGPTKRGSVQAVGRLSRCRSRGVAWPNTRPCQGRERRFESGRDRHNRRAGAVWRGGRVRLKATVSKTVMGHWPIESSNLSLSATAFGEAFER